MSSQFVGPKFVPWYNSDEWREVYNQIYSDSDERKELRKSALSMMHIWKRKTGDLPAGIQGTIEVLEAVLMDENSCAKTQQSVYSMALMRFLNLMVDAKDYRAGSMFRVAQTLKIPDWMISLRHDVAHNIDLPPLAVLRAGSDFSLQWLYEEYWQPESQLIEDYVITELDTETDQKDLNKLLTFILSFYDKIIKAMYPENGYVLINDIEDEKLKQYIMNEVCNLTYRNPLLISAESSLKYVVTCVLQNIEEVMNAFKHVKSRYKMVVDVLLTKTCFVDNVIITNDKQRSKADQCYIKLWSRLLMYLNSVGALSILMQRLMDINCSDDVSVEKRKAAGIWIENISKSIARYKRVKIQMEINQISTYTVIDAYRDEIRKRPELNNRIKLDYRTPIDAFFTGAKALKYFLVDAAGVPTGIYWLNVLYFTEKQFSPESIHRILHVQDLIQNGDTTIHPIPNDIFDTPLQADHVYSVQDLNQIQKIFTKSTEEVGYDETNPLWTDAPAHYDWSSCPLGRLPWT